jgi:tetratricopeptide (TPR) repeat protein
MKPITLALVVACLVTSACNQGRQRPAGVELVGGPTGGAAPAMPPPAAGMAPAMPVVSSQGPTDSADADYGSWRRTISTKSAEAQQSFNRALVWTFAFNHDEAIRHYQQAAKQDPACPMPWWGIALVNGPHINNPTLSPDRAKAAWAALQEAKRLSAAASPVERDLIEALGKRYSEDPKAERRPFDEAYAAAMRACWQAHQDDADVGTLFAESLMDLHPWDLWTLDGKPKQVTEEVVATLEAVLTRWPNHPGANHLYIHAVEASPNPASALPSADLLNTLVPVAGHLVHMPSHIYIRVGRFADASKANERAIEVDERNSPTVPAAGFYRMYMAHNRHFLAFSSMMEGRSAAALAAARQMVARVPKEMIEQQGFVVDGMMNAVLHVMIRFGRWEDVLKEPEFPKTLPISAAIRHYARGIALTALGRLPEAETEQQALGEAIKLVPADRTIGNNPAHTVLGIPVRMLGAEIAFRKGKHDESFAAFREAIAIEDGLVYDEPPDWMQPVRHAFGASLLAAKRWDEAEKVFRQDLARFPGNGWALTGLARCLRAKGAADAAEVAAQVERAFERADVPIASPCFCQPGG